MILTTWKEKWGRFRLHAAIGFQSLAHRDKRVRISIAILACVVFQVVIIGFIPRGIDSRYIRNSPSLLGKNDMILRKDTQNSFPDVHFESNTFEAISRGIPEIISLPRLYSVGEIAPATDLSIEPYETLIVGLNFSREQAIQRHLTSAIVPNSIGDFRRLDETLNRTEDVIREDPPFGSCLLTRKLAEKLQVSAGERLDVDLITGNQYLDVYAIVDNDGRLPERNAELLIVDLLWLQHFLALQGKINVIFGVFKNPEDIYNLRDPDASFVQVGNVADRVTAITGPGYVVTFPRLLTLQLTQTNILALTTIIYAAFLTAMVCLIVIFYKIEKANLLRCSLVFFELESLGISRRDLFWATLAREIWLGLITTGLGLLSGALVSFFVLQIAIWNFTLLSLGIFLLVAVVSVGILAAVLNRPHFISFGASGVRAHEILPVDDCVRKKKRTSNISPVYFGVGLAISSLAITGVFLLPVMILDFSLLLLSQFGFTLVLAAFLGFAILIGGFVGDLGKKIQSKMRREGGERQGHRKSRSGQAGTPSLFSSRKAILVLVTFSLVFYISTFQQVRNQNLYNQIRFGAGSDVVITSGGDFDEDNYLNQTFLGGLYSRPEIKAVAPIFSNRPLKGSYLQQVIGIAQQSDAEFSTEDTDFKDFLTGTVSNTSTVLDYPKISTVVYDLGLLKEMNCELLGTNASYLDVIDPSSISWDGQSGSSKNCFSELFAAQHTCVIPKSLAELFNVGRLGEKIVLEIIPNNLSEKRVVTLTVVGIAEGLPGIPSFKSMTNGQRNLAGILVNMADYLDFQGMSSNLNYPVDRCLVQLQSGLTVEEVKQFKVNVWNEYAETYFFRLEDPISQIQYLKITDESTTILLELAFYLLVVLSVGFVILLQVPKVFSKSMERVNQAKINHPSSDPTMEVRDDSQLKIPALPFLVGISIILLFLAQCIGLVGTFLLVSLMAQLTSVPVIMVLDYFLISWKLGLCIFLVAFGICVWERIWRSNLSTAP